MKKMTEEENQSSPFFHSSIIHSLVFVIISAVTIRGWLMIPHNSADFYQTIERLGGWNIGKKFQVLAFVPYNFNHQNSDEGVTNKQGLGDIPVSGSYKVFDSLFVT